MDNGGTTPEDMEIDSASDVPDFSKEQQSKLYFLHHSSSPAYYSGICSGKIYEECCRISDDDDDEDVQFHHPSSSPAYYSGICSGKIYEECCRISDDDDDEDVQIIERPNLFENLVDVILIEIFGHLNARDLRRAARVCKRWQKIAKESTLWNTYDTADMGIFHSNLIEHVSKLPSYITRLRICLTDNPVTGINLPSISLLINERCPNLEELYIQGCLLSSFSVSVGSIPATVELMKEENINFNNQGIYGRHSSVMFLPMSLRVLSFRDLRARSMPILFRLRSAKQLQKLEVLDYSVACFKEKTTGPWLLRSCPNLKELHLVRSYVASGIGPLVRFFHNLKVLNLSDSCFTVEDLKKLHQFSKNLEELYLCQMDFRDDDLHFVNRNTFPCLEIICLSGSRITMQSVTRLFRDCRSLRRFHANFANGSKCGFYTVTGRGYSFHETSKCSMIHVCKYKHHI